MTLRKFALDYSHGCTVEELREFYRQRTGNLRREMGRSKCIRKVSKLTILDDTQILTLHTAPKARF